MWSQSFGHLLALREKTQHTKCSSCIRHKLILKKLGGDQRARQAQMRLFAAHLCTQYADRTVYWRARNRSREKHLDSGIQTLEVVVDAIDHAKFRYPRSNIFSAKDLAAPETLSRLHGKYLPRTSCNAGSFRTCSRERLHL